jgi:hypothetical protein
MTTYRLLALIVFALTTQCATPKRKNKVDRDQTKPGSPVENFGLEGPDDEPILFPVDYVDRFERNSTLGEFTGSEPTPKKAVANKQAAPKKKPPVAQKKTKNYVFFVAKEGAVVYKDRNKESGKVTVLRRGLRLVGPSDGTWTKIADGQYIEVSNLSLRPMKPTPRTSRWKTKKKATSN